MRTVLGLSIVLALASAGCGGGTHHESTASSSQDDWSSSPSSTTATSTGVDAGLDGGAAADPERDRAMALFARSCTPCHRHDGPVDMDAVARGVYLETEADIVSHLHEYTIGATPTSLASVIGQRAEGYDLLVGANQRTPMPPPGSGYPAWTQQEAQQVRDWMRTRAQ